MKRRKALSLFGGALVGSASCSLASNTSTNNNSAVDEFVIDALGRDLIVENEVSLKERAKSKGLFYGSALRESVILKDDDYIEYFVQQCGLVVPEGSLKWKALRPAPGRFDFSNGDLVLQFAEQYELPLRGHTLVWDKSIPDWLPDTLNSSNAERILDEHISAILHHYSGRIHSWDVVNEAVLPYDGRSDNLRKSLWLETLGPSYIETAFHMASEADPSSLLVYNDNRMDHAGYQHDKKREAVLDLLLNLKSKNTPVDALGIQAHLFPEYFDFDFHILREFLANVASLGLKIIITEMDVTDRDFPASIESRDKIVAAIYEDYLSCVLDEPAVMGVMTWGLTDRYSWISMQRPRADGLPVRPLPLDSDFNRKPAWHAIARAFDNAPSR